MRSAFKTLQIAIMMGSVITLNKDMRAMESLEMEDETSKQTLSTPYRLRNHSYQQANSSVVQSIPEEQPDQEGCGEDTGSMEDIIKPKMLIRKEDWHRKSQAVKLDTIFEAVNKMYAVHEEYQNRLKPLEFAVFDKDQGILPQLSKMASCAKDAGSKQNDLEADNKQLREELEIVKGMVSKQGKQIQKLQGKLADQTARAMSDHVVISGILGDTKEADVTECVALFSGFMEEQLESNLEREEIIHAYRLGRFVEGKHWPLVVRVTNALQQRIFNNTSKLAEKQNSSGRFFSVNPLLPDSLAEQRCEIRKIIKDKKDSEKHLPKQQKSSFLVRGGKVYINGQQKRKILKAPDLRDLFVDSDEQLKINRIKTKTVEDPPVRGSKFRAVAVNVPKLNDVHLAYMKMFQLYPHADHIVAAFATENEEGFQDNGKYGAGHRILKVIKDSKLYQVAIFVIREYGGQHLGPKRFDIMCDLASRALEALV